MLYLPDKGIFDIIHVILRKPFHYLFKLECANEMTCYCWCRYVQTRNLPYTTVKIVFSSLYKAFDYNI